MNLIDLLTSSTSTNVAQNAENKFGISKNQIIALMAVAAPLVISHLRKKSEDSNEAEALERALDKDHDGTILDDPEQVNNRINEGNSILDHIFGNQKNVVENQLSSNTGISMDKIGPVLSMLAPVIMGYIGKEKRSSGGSISDLLGGILGQAQQKAEPSSPINDILGQVLGGAQGADSNPLGEIIGNLTGSQSKAQGGLGDLLGGLLGGKR